MICARITYIIYQHVFNNSLYIAYIYIRATHTNTIIEMAKDENTTTTEEKKPPFTPKVHDGKAHEEPETIKPEQEIPIEGDKKSGGEKVKVNFMNKDFIKDYVSKKTVKSDEPTPGGESSSDKASDDKEKETTEELRERIKKDEEAYEKQFTPEDFEEIAGFIIDLVDAGISTALRVWAKDTSSRNYELEKSKKDKLAKQGKLILIKHKLKWSVEFVFVLSLVIFYAGPIQKARQRRKMLASESTSSTSTKTSGKEGGNEDESSEPTKETGKPRTPPKRGGKGGSK